MTDDKNKENHVRSFWGTFRIYFIGPGLIQMFTYRATPGGTKKLGILLRLNRKQLTHLR